MRNREPLLRLLAVSLLLYMLLGFGAARVRLNAAREEERTLSEDCAALRDENGELRRQIASARDDASLEAMARERLGLVMPGERIYYFN